jgi:hypothetical protein
MVAHPENAGRVQAAAAPQPATAAAANNDDARPPAAPAIPDDIHAALRHHYRVHPPPASWGVEGWTIEQWHDKTLRIVASHQEKSRRVAARAAASNSMKGEGKSTSTWQQLLIDAYVKQYGVDVIVEYRKYLAGGGGAAAAGLGSLPTATSPRQSRRVRLPPRKLPAQPVEDTLSHDRPRLPARKLPATEQTATPPSGAPTAQGGQDGHGPERPAQPGAPLPSPSTYRVVVRPAARAPPLPAASSSWVVDYTYTCPPLPSAAAGWVAGEQSCYVWGGIDFDAYGPLPRGRFPMCEYCFNQIVPQCMTGRCMAGNDSKYRPAWQVFPDQWAMQASYYWERAVQDIGIGHSFCATGPLVFVEPGEKIYSRISCAVVLFCSV